MSHPDLLRPWLRGKGLHPADVAAALEWYDAEVRAGRQPTDHAVLAHGEQCHANAVGQYRSLQPTPLTVTHTHPPVRWVWPLVAGLSSALTVETLHWIARAWLW